MKASLTQNHSRSEALLKTSVVVFLFIVGAKLLNFYKKILIGQLFGVSSIADAFFAASYLPYYVGVFFEGVVFLGFLPLFSQIFSEKGEAQAGEFAGQVLFSILFFTGIIAILGWFIAPWFVSQLVPGFNPEARELTISILRILSFVVIFLSLASLFRALHSFYGQYALAASAGLVDTAVMIGALFLCWKAWGIYGAAWAAVAGTAAAFIFQWITFAHKKKIIPITLPLQGFWLQKLFVFLIPVGIIWIFQQIPFLILNRFGSGMWEGTISALVISQTMTTVPMGLVSHTVLLAIFPTLARQAGETEQENLKDTFFQTLRVSFLILIPIGCLLSAFNRPLAVLFFSGGGISTEGTLRIANALMCFGWATFGLYADLFMTQSLIAVRKTRPAIYLCAVRALLTYALSFFLSSLWDYQGLALSFSLALVINLFVCFPLFFRMSALRGRWNATFVYCLKLLGASSPLLFLLYGLNRWPLAEWIALSRISLILILFFAGSAFLLAYVYILTVMRIKELGALVDSLKRSWMKKGWSLADSTQ